MLYCLSSSRHVVPVVVVMQSSVGEWLSLVEHLVRDQGVGGSNPLSPTKSKGLIGTHSGRNWARLRESEAQPYPLCRHCTENLANFWTLTTCEKATCSPSRGSLFLFGKRTTQARLIGVAQQRRLSDCNQLILRATQNTQVI